MADNLCSIDLSATNVIDLAYTLGERRTKHSCRGYFLASQSSMKEDFQVEKFKWLTPSHSPVRYSLAFVFTGQGAQWAQMGKELIEEFPTFRQSITQLDAILQHLPHPASFSILDVILQPAETSEVNQVSKSQPTCTAIQIALVDLIHHWGIRPTSVVGHSSGEIAAAYAANVISAAEAITIAYYRGYVIEKLTDSSSGAMLATALSPPDAESKIRSLGLDDHIRIACKNSPESVTISGDAPAIEHMHNHCQDNDVFSRKLVTDGRAYHSHHIGKIGHEYDNILRGGLASLPAREYSAHDIEWVSSLTGEYVRESVPTSYWRQNAESPVLFCDAVERLVENKNVHFIEIGPHRALQLPIRQTMKALGREMSEYQYSSLMARKCDSLRSSLDCVAELFLHGHDVDFGHINRVGRLGVDFHSQPRQGKVIPNLPPYPWTYNNLLWNEPRASREFRNRKHKRHELLGSQIPGANAFQIVWRNLLSLHDVPWMRDHRLGQETVFPAAAYIAMALEAVRQVTVQEVFGFSIHQLRILKGLVLPDDTHNSRVELITSIRPYKISSTNISDTWFEFDISSIQDQSSTLHAFGYVGSNPHSFLPEVEAVHHIMHSEAQSTHHWYKQLVRMGMNFGPKFQSLEHVRSAQHGDKFHSQASIQCPELSTKESETQLDYLIHPIIIDALLQTAIYPVTCDPLQGALTRVPLSIGSADFRAFDSKLQFPGQTAFATSQKFGFGSVMSNCQLGAGPSFAQIQDLYFGPYEAASRREISSNRYPILRSEPCR